MYVTGPAICRECGAAVGLSGGFCTLCPDLFCADHLVTRKGVATCRGCEGKRLTLEASSEITDAVEQRVIDLLTSDLIHTTGGAHEEVVIETAARQRLFSDTAGEYELRVVEDVQQQLHDMFIDTTWPGCPRHPNHPLWYANGHWRCERDDQAIAPLGSLSRES